MADSEGGNVKNVVVMVTNEGIPLVWNIMHSGQMVWWLLVRDTVF